MILYLVQHGKCVSKDEDPGRPLSVTGREQTREVAGIVARAEIPVVAIRHSGKLRSVQTAELLASALGVSDVDQEAGIQPLDDVELFSRKIDSFDGYMVVGHLPFMERLVSFLITGEQESGVVRFRNSGIVCLAREEGEWHIRWALVPELAG